MDNNIKIIEDFFLNNNVSVDINNFILAIINSLILALIVKYVYKKVSRSLNDKEHFSEIFIPLAIITTLVITVVKFSLALSLGLVGALSIVRFRAAIKEPEELVFLFFIIGIGLANGANQFLVGYLATFLICFILIIRSIYKDKYETKNATSSSTNILQIQIYNNSINIEELMSLLDKDLNYINLKSTSSEKNYNQYNFWFDLDVQKSIKLIREINNITMKNKDIKIQLFSRSGVYE